MIMDVWWQDAGQTVREEFSDLPDATGVTRITLRLLIAAILGGALGFEHEQGGRRPDTHVRGPRGRLFVLMPQQAGVSDTYLTRVLQGLAAGAGFLLAGTILKGSGA